MTDAYKLRDYEIVQRISLESEYMQEVSHELNFHACVPCFFNLDTCIQNSPCGIIIKIHRERRDLF